VDCYTVVKILLGGAHLYSHTKTLKHLITSSAHHMKPNHLLLWPNADKLHHRLLLSCGQSVVHRRELCLIDNHLSILRHCLRLSESNSANRGMGEDHTGDV